MGTDIARRSTTLPGGSRTAHGPARGADQDITATYRREDIEAALTSIRRPEKSGHRHTAHPAATTEPMRTHGRSWSQVSVAFGAGQALADACLVPAAVLAVAMARAVATGRLLPLETGLVVAAAAALVWCLTAAAFGGYQSARAGFGGGSYRPVFPAAGAAFATLAALDLLGAVDLPRTITLWAPVAALFACCLERSAARRTIRRRRSAGTWLTRAVVVSSGRAADRMVARLSDRVAHGLDIVGVAADRPQVADLGLPVVAGLADLPHAVRTLGVEVVVIDSHEVDSADLKPLMWSLESTGVEILVSPGLMETAPDRLSVLPSTDVTLLRVELEAPRSTEWTKTVFDRLAGLGLVLAASPLLIAVGLAVKLTSRGPVFFKQTRVGQRGEPFRMWKFRSMYVDAEARKAELMSRSEGAGLLFKMKDDPRVTPVGKLIRRFSIDELPQLFNVVGGTMSLVGPRPALPSEVAHYSRTELHRLKVKPGMTGLWQVSGRSDLSWEESVRLDLRYSDNWSPRMDLAILWSTLGAVVGGKGAY